MIINNNFIFVALLKTIIRVYNVYDSAHLMTVSSVSSSPLVNSLDSVFSKSTRGIQRFCISSADMAFKEWFTIK